ncbi:MAG: cation-translocating P-type ATPase [Oscillospiraceae bacterium]|nr:cation-translocating P-type ATPase [Oscillospiraceae bacterium]
MLQAYQTSKEELWRDGKTSAEGLNTQEADRRRIKFGPNELRQRTRTPLLKLFLDAWQDPMILILAIVVVVQMVLGEFLEAVVIFAVLVVNSLISVIQTRKAESSLEALRAIAAPIAKVRRDGGIMTVPARELVPGDVVILEAGDFVPADGRIIECNALKVDEGILTGESESVLKTDETLTGKLPLGDRINMAYSGTVAVHGRGVLLITATGAQAEIGKIAALLELAEERQTPLQRRLEHFSKRLGIWILGLCVLIFLVETFRTFQAGEDLQRGMLNALLFAIAVAVAAIPEALSSIVTIVLAVGTKKMAARSAIIRKLPAVEALGSTGVICTDKTGTLTQNKMTVVDQFLPGRGTVEASLLLPALALCNDASIKPDGTRLGDPTETALVEYVDQCGRTCEELREAYARCAELPFDSDRKLMSTLHAVDGGRRMFTKGAPDVLFSRCTKVLIDGGIRTFGPEERVLFEQANERFSERALRVLAFATKEMGADAKTLTLADEQGLTLIGLAAMIDPPREAVYASIAEARRAGIKTVMITGDHKTTAYAIAREIGIVTEGDVAVTGTELDAMTEAELDEKLRHISVYARVSPENKIRIVRAWQKKGQITAMTGDGVNDAPSLRQADIGIAMGSGTEVAKDAAAMILTDDNFASIVSAVSIGRTIFDNIKKAVGYLFSGNLGAIIAILFALAVGWDKPLTPLQILFINLLNDSIPAIALGLEKAEPTVMDRPPRDMNEGIFGGGLFQSVVTRGVLIGIVTILAQYIGMMLFSPAMGSAMAFTTLILARTLQTFSSRSNSQTILQAGPFSNPYALGAVGICFLLYSVTLLPGAREVFYIPAAFGLAQWGIAAGLALGAVVLMEIFKGIRNKVL